MEDNGEFWLSEELHARSSTHAAKDQPATCIVSARVLLNTQLSLWADSAPDAIAACHIKKENTQPHYVTFGAQLPRPTPAQSDAS